MKKASLIGAVLLLISSMLFGACNVPQQEIEKYIAEMGELASKLNSMETLAAKGNWEEARRIFEQAKIHHASIDAGIDELEKKGVDSTQIERGRTASTYLQKAFEVIDHMLIVHMEIAESRPRMEEVSKGTKEDVVKALDALNELLVLIRNTKGAITSFLEYANDYYSNNPDDAEKLHADTVIPKMGQLINQLEERESNFKRDTGRIKLLDRPALSVDGVKAQVRVRLLDYAMSQMPLIREEVKYTGQGKWRYQANFARSRWIGVTIDTSRITVTLNFIEEPEVCQIINIERWYREPTSSELVDMMARWEKASTEEVEESIELYKGRLERYEQQGRGLSEAERREIEKSLDEKLETLRRTRGGS